MRSYLTRPCEQCSTVFRFKPYRINEARFCSRRCQADAQHIPALIRFEAKRTVTEACWPWTGHRRGGYGRIRNDEGVVVDTHRFAYEQASGAPIPDGMWVLHTCDIRHCVRNDDPGLYILNGIAHPRFGHLWLGTLADNNADAAAKGRSCQGDEHWTRSYPERMPKGDAHWTSTSPERTLKGEQHPSAHLTEDGVREIRAAYATGSISQRALGRQYGVNQVTIGKIVRRETWPDV